ncbi:MAG TPA: Crp/Fnr family transcriptional regulator, partial [Solirubrobacteraceae bacterium]|nr:Crp/Fnr family transcriptional regulator [Solirubrobacteraceae bacterium]
MTTVSLGRRGAHVVRVLEEDPELAEGIPAAERERAIHEAVAVCHESPRGPLDPYLPATDDPGDLGVLLLEGFAGRTVELSGRTTLELLGPGDVGRPWDVLREDDAAVHVETRWTAIQPVRWAVLDYGFARVAGQWPELMSALMARALERARRQTLCSAASVLPRLQDRLVVLLWLVADRWGRVTRDGVVVPIRMTQAQLAAMAGARRPSVSTAMTALAARGIVTRQRGGGWCLTPAAAEHVATLSDSGGTDEVLRRAASAATRLAPALVPA